MLLFLLHKKNQRAFSLIEILAAVTVLAILAIMITQILNATNKTTRLSNQTLDAASQSRQSLDRIGRDLAGLIKRIDIPFEAEVPTAANPDANILSFFSIIATADSAMTSANNRGVSLVTYRISVLANYNDNRPCLVRSGKALAWDSLGSTSIISTGFMGLTPAEGLPVLYTDLPSVIKPSADSFDVLAPGIFRLIVGYVLYPDDVSVTLLDGTTFANAQGQVVYSPPIIDRKSSGTGITHRYIDLNRISAIVIGLVAVDQENLKLLTASHIGVLQAKFPTPANNILPLQAWSSLANNLAGDATLNALPLQTRQSIRVYQRFYAITPFASRADL